MTPSCAWRSPSRCAMCWSTGRVISARWTGTRPRPCVIPRCAWRASRMKCWLISTRTRSISAQIMTVPSMSPWCCRPASRTCWSTVPAALPWAWPPTSRRIIWPRWSAPAWPSLTGPSSASPNSCATSPARISRPRRSSTVRPASARPMRPAAGASMCAPYARSRSRRPATGSSSASCRIRSTRRACRKRSPSSSRTRS